MHKNFETFIGCDSSYEQAGAVIFGAPYDSTTSYRPGTRFASKAMRSESFGIETYSPYQDKDLTDKNIFDGGDLELPFGNVSRTIGMVEDFTAQVLSDGKLPVMLGGEHLLSFGAVRAVYNKFPDLCIIHLDAHADLRDDYLGETLSHATVMRRIHEFVGDGKIFQFGIRSGEAAEFAFAARHTVLNKFNLNGFDEALHQLKGKPVYFTLDLDVLDSSVFPGTGTPEAGGISFNQLLDCITKLGHLNIVGADLMELSPIYDQSGASTAVACKVLREILLAMKF